MRQGVRLPASFALACLASVAAIVVLAYVPGTLSTLDANALDGLSALQGPVATPALKVIAHTGDPLPLALMLAAVLVTGFSLGRRRQALVATAAVIVANVATQVLKLVLAHPRFYPVLGAHQLDATAFPSGHATASMSIALAAVMVCPPSYRRWAGPVAAAYVLAVATSILVLAWHFPSDVFGGFLVAAGFAFASVAISRALAARDRSPRRGRQTSLAIPPLPVIVGVGGLAAALILVRHEDLVQFEQAHTSGVAALAGVAMTCALLLAGASRVADR